MFKSDCAVFTLDCVMSVEVCHIILDSVTSMMWHCDWCWQLEDQDRHVTQKEQEIVKMRSRMDTMHTLLKSKVSAAPVWLVL